VFSDPHCLATNWGGRTNQRHGAHAPPVYGLRPLRFAGGHCAPHPAHEKAPPLPQNRKAQLADQRAGAEGDRVEAPAEGEPTTGADRCFRSQASKTLRSYADSNSATRDPLTDQPRSAVHNVSAGSGRKTGEAKEGKRHGSNQGRARPSGPREERASKGSAHANCSADLASSTSRMNVG